MAKMKFRYGTMKSGKSQELIRVHYNYKFKNQETLNLTSAIDDRHGVGLITTRAGGEIEAYPVHTIEDLRKFIDVLDRYQCVLIDEVQFMSKEMIEFIKNEFVIKRETAVIAYGLKSDFQNNLFEGTQACFVHAEDIKEIETVCQYCDKKAIMNLRLNNGVKAKDGDQIMIGDEEYIQVCNEHWNC